MQDTQAMANHVQVWRREECNFIEIKEEVEGASLNERPSKESEGSGW